jgi:LmbE family N-acetylglucosaminyl deacetylase
VTGQSTVLPTRHEFLLALTGGALSPLATAEGNQKKLLIVVAHPDDEYAVVAITYRLVRELGWTADQVVITNGEAGYRYSALAETFYGVGLTTEAEGRSHLPSIRKDEALRAGKILGIRHLHFLDQKDSGFSTNAAAADTQNWDRKSVEAFLTGLLQREQYDVVLTLLPTQETHGHHRAATLLALEAVSSLAPERRPLVFGAEARSSRDVSPRFAGLAAAPLTSTISAEPVLRFDRAARFGYRSALDYQVVVNWVIAEHKSQGLFQMDCGRHDMEELWLFEVSGAHASSRAGEFRRTLQSAADHVLTMAK